jgi:hypothetical protein
LGLWDKAISVVSKLAESNGLPGAYRMRALQAEQYFLEESGRSEEALELDPKIEQLELRYADEDEEDAEVPVIDYDLERLPDDMLVELGISEDDARYAPEDEADNGYEDDSDQSSGKDDETPGEERTDDDIVSPSEANDANLGVDATVDELSQRSQPGSEQADDFDETDLPGQEAQQGADADGDPAGLTGIDGSHAGDADVSSTLLSGDDEPESSLNEQDEEA